MLHLFVPKWTCIYVLQLIMTSKPQMDNQLVFFGKQGKGKCITITNELNNLYECFKSIISIGNVNPLSFIYSNWPIYLEIKFCQFRERSIGNWSCRLGKTGSFFYLDRKEDKEISPKVLINIVGCGWRE